jgi:hypothetical protein
MKAVVLGLGVLAAAGAGYYFGFYPPVVKEREAARALDSFAQAIASKNRATITQSLEGLLAADARIRLSVHMFAIGQPGRPALVQEFDKPAFIRFIDNTLYPLTDYGYSARIVSFSLKNDSEADVALASKEWADGSDMYGGVAVNMRFSSDTQCTGSVRFAGEAPQVAQLSCEMQFRSVPKPGEAQRLNNIDGLRDLLIKQR